MDTPDDDAPEIPERRVTREAFEMELAAISNGASLFIGDSIVGQFAGERDAPTSSLEDARAVWHAAEVALAILSPGYIPKCEAVGDVRAMLAWYDDGDDTWLRTD